MPVTLLDISISKPRPKTTGVLRTFDDGTVEVGFGNGIRARRKPYICSGCGVSQIQHGLNALSAKLMAFKICAKCLNAEAEERRRAKEMEHEARRGIAPTAGQRRYIALVLATPEWRDREAIRMIYAEATRISEATGVEHQVDHIYPIQSEYGCGLHVHQNLRIITKAENCSKNNKFPMYDSPALK